MKNSLRKALSPRFLIAGGTTWRLGFIIMVVLVVLITAVQPNYILSYNILVKLRTWMPLILTDYGQTFVYL